MALSATRATRRKRSARLLSRQKRLRNRVRIENASATVDLTTKVPNGYLYGGSFSNKECTTPWSYGTESAKSFRPQSGATYYIWEAPVDYLVPKSLSLSKTIDGQPNVIGFYLLTGVDRLNYQSAGFDVTDGDGKAIPITDVGEDTPYHWRAAAAMSTRL